MSASSFHVRSDIRFDRPEFFFRQGQFAKAIPHFEKAAALMETDYNDPGLLISCYNALGDAPGRDDLVPLPFEQHGNKLTRVFVRLRAQDASLAARSRGD